MTNGIIIMMRLYYYHQRHDLISGEAEWRTSTVKTFPNPSAVVHTEIMCYRMLLQDEGHATYCSRTTAFPSPCFTCCLSAGRHAIFSSTGEEVYSAQDAGQIPKLSCSHKVMFCLFWLLFLFHPSFLHLKRTLNLLKRSPISGEDSFQVSQLNLLIESCHLLIYLVVLSLHMFWSI